MIFLRNWRSPWLLVGCGFALLIIIAVWWRSGQSQTSAISVTRGNISQTVSFTGRVVPAKEVALNFEQSGRVVFVGARVGDRVNAGQILISLDSRSATADLQQAQADVLAERARLLEVKKGTRAEELAVRAGEVQQAEKLVQDRRQELVAAIRDGYAKADNAVHYNAAQAFDSPGSNSDLSFIIPDRILRDDLESDRQQLEKMFSSWDRQLNLMAGQLTSQGLELAINNLAKVQDFLNQLALATNQLSDNDYSAINGLTVTEIKTSIANARALISTTIDNLFTANTAYNSAQSALATAQDELNLSKAGSTEEAVMAQMAKVESAEAKVGSLQAKFSKMSLMAPFAGVIVEQEAEVGETVNAGEVMMAINSSEPYQLEAKVPEITIAKIMPGIRGVATLDAYADNGLTFPVTVAKIDPGETVVDGVVTYKVTLGFDQTDERIRSGMTADVKLITGEKREVLKLPLTAISGRAEGEPTVLLLKDNQSVTTSVTLGLIGDNGEVEIVSGLQLGDRVASSD